MSSPPRGAFAPVAIVGRACLLPGASSPEALGDAVMAGRDLLAHAPVGRWGVPFEELRCAPPGGEGRPHTGDRCWSDVGGYVQGFEQQWSPDGFAVDPAELDGLDPVFLWPLHTARQALAGLRRPAPERTGAWLGNLGFPSAGLSRFAEWTWLSALPGFGEAAARKAGLAPAVAANRFMMSGPAALLSRALEIQGGAFSLDAACASSLYALALACQALHDGRVDLALAGAVQKSDDLFIHVGFCALSAMSKSGRSRPFHAGADGLVPAEGAGFLALKRLEDALRDGDPVHAVIRGVGLSNDGRGRGLLAPAEEGQARAMQAAWDSAGLDPKSVGLVECHATGTPVGDGTELKSMARVFQGVQGLPIASLKSNLGHLITAAGVAGIIKVTEAMRRGQRAPTLHVDQPHPDLKGGPFRLVQMTEPWEGSRRAAVSAFGFGGNNAHVVLDPLPEPGWSPALPPASKAPELAVVGIGAAVGALPDAPAWAQALAEGRSLLGPQGARADQVHLDLAGLRFPPRDLQDSLGQQTLLLQAAREAVVGLDLPRDRTTVLIGMETDPEVSRYGLRWRIADWRRAWGADEAWLSAARDRVVAELSSAGVLGTMPNIPANRLNSQLDLAGPSFVLAGGEGSGLLALQLAARDLRAGALDAAVIGAVDLCCEPVHQAARPAGAPPPGDAAVVLVLKRRLDAEARGDRILALLADDAGPAPALDSLVPSHGDSGAAQAMVQLGAAVLLLATGARDRLSVSAPGLPPVRLRAPPKPAALPVRPPAGPRLDLVAHLPPVTLPPLPAALGSSMPPSSPPAQSMPPAPALPPVQGGPAVDLRPPVPPAAVPAPTVTPGPIAAVAADPADPAWALQQQVGWLQETHQRFLARQAEAHRQFLQVRQHAMFALLERSGGLLPGPAPVPPPATPVPVAPVPVAPAPAAPAPTPRPVAAPTPAPAAAPPKPTPVVAAAPLPKPTPVTSPGGRPRPVGPRLDRDGLMVHASGNISQIFGDLFKPQDAWHRVCRMPEPPLLLADRMTGVDAVPGSMGKGTIWTETDVQTDSWYLNQGRMPSGIMIESGQADLMLISYLGVDLLNRGERVYRLLGCQLTYHRDLPAPGETLCYDIHVDGHANHGDVRLFFFHYDCVIDGKPALTVRQGQAGFFTDAELAASAGILWKPEEQEIVAEPRLDPPEVVCEKRRFSGEEIAAFSEGRAWDCFGEAFAWCKTHNRPPAIQQGRMLFLHEVSDLDRQGGPWGRGYLRAVQHLQDEDWFYQGHFKNDPCMPGTLMFEGCVQAMSFYLASMGVTCKRDGWRFQPVQGEMFDLRCRGQAIPGNKVLVYEVFVEEFVAGPVPTLYADLLCTIDGLKAFHARRVGIQLVPDWPITSMPELWGAPVPPGAPADHLQRPIAHLDGFRFDYKSLLACAWGKPSDAFGPMYSRFDGTRRVARLPGPPYHFMSRVTRIAGPRPVTEVDGRLVPGAEIELQFDIDPQAWFFRENGAATVPYCVFLEAALQPCGWLASYVGSALTVDRDLSFRNLDGTATWDGELFPDAGTLTTKVKIVQISKTAGMIIEGFEVGCYLNDAQGAERRVYSMKTVFGFFPKEALENQVGLPTTDLDRAFLRGESDFLLDLVPRPPRYCSGSARLPSPMLLMVDRITGYWPEGGAAGLGRIRGEKDVDPAEWFFKAHFFQDPVQPGSLGLEALVQLLQWAMLHRGMDEGIEGARFEPLMQGREMVWKYRGQVVPSNRLISSTMELTEVGRDERGPFVIGNGSLWVDGKRIYEVQGMGMRIVSGGPLPAGPPPSTEPAPTPFAPVAISLDPARDRWILDHRPTWTVPSLPMMVIADLLARPVVDSGRTVTGLSEVKVRRWLVVDGPVELLAQVVAEGEGVVTVQLSREGEVLASGKVRFGAYAPAPRPTSSLSGSDEGDLYSQGRLFHGPAFQLLRRLVLGRQGASASLQAPPGAPQGPLHPALLDGATHPIPHEDLGRWTPGMGGDKVAYPAVLQDLSLYGPTPAQDALVRCEVRPAGNLGSPDLPVFDIELSTPQGVWARMKLVEACFPKGPLGMAAPADRLAFLRDGRHVPGLGLSRVAEDGSTRLTEAEVAASDWLPGTVQALYGTREVAEIARRDHLAARVGVHPRVVEDALPLNEIAVDQFERDGGVALYDGGVERLDLSAIESFWADWFHMGDRWPVEDLYYGLMRRFLRRVIVTDPEATGAVLGRPMLYLANHQVGVESLLFSILASGLNAVPTVTVAKAEHRETWLGQLIQLCFRYPGVVDPKVITYFDRDDKASLVGIIQDLARGLVTPMEGKGGARAPGQSVMVHVEGTRNLDCRSPVQKMSGAFIDMALQTATPIVPVRFTGGLPVAPLAERIEFPVGLGTQDVWLGRPLMPEELRALPYGERKKRVIAAMNALGPAHAVETPHEGDPGLEEAVADWSAKSGARHEHAVLYRVLQEQARLSEGTEALLAAIASGGPVEGDDAPGAWLRELRARLDPRGAGSP